MPPCLLAYLGLGFDFSDVPERLTVSLSLASLSVVHDTVQAALTELNIVAS